MFRVFPFVKIHKDIDLDAPIYRYVPFDYIEEILDKKILFFQNISKWEDPWENPSRFLITGENSPLYVTKQIAPFFYATCWSSGSANEGLWKVYSTNKRHVRLRTTIRKLLLSTSINLEKNVDCFIAPVIYADLEDLSVVKSLVEDNTDYLKYYAPMYLKRKYYNYEKEIRFTICTLDKCPKGILQENRFNNLYLNLRDNSFIDEIELDPRLTKDEFEHQKKLIAKYGVNVFWKPLYELPETVVINHKHTYSLEVLPDSCRIWDGEMELEYRTVKRIMNKYYNKK